MTGFIPGAMPPPSGAHAGAAAGTHGGSGRRHVHAHPIHRKEKDSSSHDNSSSSFLFLLFIVYHVVAVVFLALFSRGGVSGQNGKKFLAGLLMLILPYGSFLVSFGCFTVYKQFVKYKHEDANKASEKIETVNVENPVLKKVADESV